MTLRILPLFVLLALVVLLAQSAVAQQPYVVDGYIDQFGNVVPFQGIFGPPVYINPMPYYVGSPVYVEPIRYWHPGHWNFWYDAYGQRWQQYIYGHWSYQPYRW